MREAALITGSSKGLGKALAKVYAKNGYDVVLHGRNEPLLEEVGEEVRNFGVDAYVIRGDLREDDTLKDLYNSAHKNNVSVLVNNAAVTCPGKSIEDLTGEQVREMIEVNLTAPMVLTGLIYPLFTHRGGGDIININSLAGLEPKNPRTTYCATKYGLRGFSDSLRLEAEGDDIEVMSVYLSKMKNSTDDAFGMNLQLVSEAIYDAFKRKNVDDLIIDGRPEKLRVLSERETLGLDGRDFEI